MKPYSRVCTSEKKPSSRHLESPTTKPRPCQKPGRQATTRTSQISLNSPSFYPWTLKVLPLAVFLSFSSLSGLARRRTGIVLVPTTKKKGRTRILTLEEVSRPAAHSGVDVRLGGLDMVVEIIAESLNVRDDIWHPLWCQMTGEENCSQLEKS